MSPSRQTSFSALVCGALLVTACAAEQPFASTRPNMDAAHAVAETCVRPGRPLDMTLGFRQFGCVCDAVWERDACIEGVALVCEMGRWRLVLDGPCGEHVSHPEYCHRYDNGRCECDGDPCFVHGGRAYVCSEGRWSSSGLAECLR